MKSRYSEFRNKRRTIHKTNRLVWLITSFFLVLFIGAVITMFLNDDAETTQVPNADQPSETAQKDNSDEDQADNHNDMSSEEETATERDNEPTESDSSQADQSEEDIVTAPEGAHLEGPWDPVGTSQALAEGDYHKNVFEEGTIDWEEKVDVLEYVSGLSEEDLIVWWLGNGGSPQEAFGVASSREHIDTWYYIHMKWAGNDQGWQATDVNVKTLTKEEREAQLQQWKEG